MIKFLSDKPSESVKRSDLHLDLYNFEDPASEQSRYVLTSPRSLEVPCSGDNNKEIFIKNTLIQSCFLIILVSPSQFLCTWLVYTHYI